MQSSWCVALERQLVDSSLTHRSTGPPEAGWWNQTLAITPQTMLLYVDSQFASPYAMSAFVALRTKRLEFEMHCIDLSSSENLTREYATASLTPRVPTLVNGTFALSKCHIRVPGRVVSGSRAVSCKHRSESTCSPIAGLATQRSPFSSARSVN